MGGNGKINGFSFDRPHVAAAEPLRAKRKRERVACVTIPVWFPERVPESLVKRLWAAHGRMVDAIHARDAEDLRRLVDLVEQFERKITAPPDARRPKGRNRSAK